MRAILSVKGWGCRNKGSGPFNFPVILNGMKGPAGRGIGVGRSGEAKTIVIFRHWL